MLCALFQRNKRVWGPKDTLDLSTTYLEVNFDSFMKKEFSRKKLHDRNFENSMKICIFALFFEL